MSAVPNLSAYGVNITPPSPVSYNLSNNLGNIASVIQDAQTAQNQANQANNQRYTQMLGVLTNSAQGQQGLYNQAVGSLGTDYGQATGALQNNLANNQQIYNNQALQIGEQKQQAQGAAAQSAVSRGLGNTTIADSMQTQVSKAASDALTNAGAAQAAADNSVYGNIANLYAAQGNTTANLQAQQGNAYAQGGDTIANAIQNATDQAPSLSQYASLIEAAQAAQGQQKSVITTTNPIPLNDRQGAASTGLNANTGSGPSTTNQANQNGYNNNNNTGYNQTISSGNTGGNTDYSQNSNFDPGGQQGGPISSGLNGFDQGTTDPSSQSYQPSLPSPDQSSQQFSVNGAGGFLDMLPNAQGGIASAISGAGQLNAPSSTPPAAQSGMTKSQYQANCHQFGIPVNPGVLSSLPD